MLKITWAALARPLLVIALVALYTWGVHQHGRHAGSADAYEAQLKAQATVIEQTVVNANDAATTATATAAETAERKITFDTAERAVESFYDNRPTREPTDAPAPCTCDDDADFFGADELRLFNLGNDPSAADHP